LVCWLLRQRMRRNKQGTEHASEQQMPAGRCTCDHEESSLVRTHMVVALSMQWLKLPEQANR
jgi:hypothetical protein